MNASHTPYALMSTQNDLQYVNVQFVILLLMILYCTSSVTKCLRILMLPCPPLHG